MLWFQVQVVFIFFTALFIIVFVKILQGIQICTSIKNTIITFTNLHSTLGKPLMKSNVVLICRLLETMKNIGYVYQKNRIVMDKLITDIIQYLEFLCLSIINEVKVRIFFFNKSNFSLPASENNNNNINTYRYSMYRRCVQIACADDRNFNAKNVDRLSSLEVAEKLIHGPLVKDRQLLLNLALNTAIGLQAFQKGQLLTLTQHLKKIEHLRLIQDNIKNISEISCMYWHRVVFPLYLKNVNKQHKNFNGLSVCYFRIFQ